MANAMIGADLAIPRTDELEGAVVGEPGRNAALKRTVILQRGAA